MKLKNVLLKEYLAFYSPLKGEVASRSDDGGVSEMSMNFVFRAEFMDILQFPVIIITKSACILYTKMLY